ncbi:hypothetical protein CTAYLR_009209 [Chrysophaeum taylorii]|uniref:PX domain-containing protein n=1 Tax=Chrysophaeum taylorii TaxID=2483200 RepID=A0AAD7U8Z1_9STRA|nr:hypothetical protein CTAYLR_009209 [Chrysophaeum taylorii]
MGKGVLQRTSTGPTRSTDHDTVVSVHVPSRGPYGVVLEDDGNGRAAVIRGWEQLGDGKSGAIERHGGVRTGDVLVGVNDVPTVDLKFSEVLELLRDENALKKVLHFSSRSEFERRRFATGTRLPVPEPRFLSRVRRARVQEPTSGTAAFAEYEVVCALRLDATKVEHESARKWTVWRRYSEFEKLASQVKRSLGWHLEGAHFPPKHALALDKLSTEFLETRRLELDVWWQKVVAVDRACDFHMHHCDPALKRFLDAQSHLRDPPNNNKPDVEDHPRQRRRVPGGVVKGARPAPLKSGLSKRRLGATTTTKGAPPSSKPPPPPPPPPSEDPDDATAAPVDPRRAALLSQIATLKIDDDDDDD